jgi:nitroreductase
MQTTFLDLVKSRYSARGYTSQKVDRETLDYIIESARLSPSACNKQPWRFVVVDDPDLISEICKKGLSAPVSNAWACTAPVIIALGVAFSPVVHTAGKLVKGIDYRLLDAGIAGEHICLAASEKGLGTCWIGWFKPKVVKKILGIPSSVKLVSLITLGYPEEQEDTPEKNRLKTEDICYFNGYGKG